ncbi:hypothetical protein TSAR_015916 [Trichomalopsis sarcophagae]|uniref:Uncharacterized protein n=1 Tax=Trichomalopsis sarcophagae TaxID=543379 RepID=A0A232EEE8_9HYME|nr:hypothetical protein TSAR_015916 [Trichomalopsis sarcophagae]
MTIRAKIVNHVYQNGAYFEPFIIGDESLKITDRSTYKMHMSMNGTFVYILENFKVLKLKINTRSENINISSFLLNTCNGNIDSFKIPAKWKTDNICNKIYGSVISVNNDLSNRIIL